MQRKGSAGGATHPACYHGRHEEALNNATTTAVDMRLRGPLLLSFARMRLRRSSHGAAWKTP
jgi:hypothetical protein